MVARFYIQRTILLRIFPLQETHSWIQQWFPSYCCPWFWFQRQPIDHQFPSLSSTALEGIPKWMSNQDQATCWKQSQDDRNRSWSWPCKWIYSTTKKQGDRLWRIFHRFQSFAHAMHFHPPLANGTKHVLDVRGREGIIIHQRERQGSKGFLHIHLPISFNDDWRICRTVGKSENLKQKFQNSWSIDTIYHCKDFNFELWKAKAPVVSVGKSKSAGRPV